MTPKGQPWSFWALFPVAELVLCREILIRLGEGPMNVTGLSIEIASALSWLGEAGLTVKDPEGFHRITPFGELNLHLLDLEDEFEKRFRALGVVE